MVQHGHGQAAGDSVTAEGAQRVLRHLRSGFSISRLACNVSTALIQPSGLAQSAVVIGKKTVAKGLFSYVSDMPRWVREVKSVSPLMRERSATFERDIHNTVGGSGTFPHDFMLRSASHVRVIRMRAGIESDLTTGISHTGIGTPDGTVTVSTGLQAGGYRLSFACRPERPGE